MEKLILHILIILLPVHINSIFLENRKAGQSPYILGLINGFCAFLTMSFSISALGLYWDLRYIPLVISFLYYGPIAGFIVLFIIFIERFMMGGDGVMIAFVSAIFAAIYPFFVRKKYSVGTKQKKIRIILTSGILIAIGQLVITYSFLHFHNDGHSDALHLFYVVLVYGVVQCFGIFASMLLHEKINEKRQMLLEIVRAEKLNTLGEMAASIAHEIRNPLTVVKGFLQLMQKQEKDNNYQYLSLILSELGRAELIINDYLNFAKPQFKKMENTRLGDLLINIVTLMESIALKNGVNLKFTVYSNPEILSDKNLLTQAFINLIKNAIEATPKKGEVIIHLNEDQDNIILKIADTGKGMSKEQLSQLGTLFYTTREKGTGIGTSVSIKIIEEMKGKVIFQSELGMGTEVTILFPRMR
ncbi:ATP-binding protein [Heyndrickxia vini]|uniref:histidine kinase n=1 Tax=Heyndrickxia vini TaxID=1476025 RepID=A0ABX7E0V5_9BACI|nr:ATP-binding protein [Heyndrickxia vini]QQZ08870.1 ATP-binding protein [Heyndrickxia vini]